MGLWLLCATILSLPYQIAAILPIETYYQVKDEFGPIVSLLKGLVGVLAKL